MEIIQADVLQLTDKHLVDEIILRQYIDGALAKAVGEVQQLRGDLQQAVGDMASATSPLLQQVAAQAEAIAQLQQQVADLATRLDTQAKDVEAKFQEVAETGKVGATALEENRAALTTVAEQVNALAAQQPEFEKLAETYRDLILRYQLEFNRAMKQKADGGLVFVEAAKGLQAEVV